MANNAIAPPPASRFDAHLRSRANTRLLTSMGEDPGIKERSVHHERLGYPRLRARVMVDETVRYLLALS